MTRVTSTRSADLAPSISPDGAIAYFAVPRPRRIDPDALPPPERIRVVTVDGSGDRTLTSRRRRSVDPDWSPDASRLIYTEARFVGRRQRPQNRQVVMNAGGTGRRVLTAFGGPDEINGKWMPDGRTILSSSGAGNAGRAPTSSQSAPMATDRARSWQREPGRTNPVRSPDGTRIVFTSDRDRRGRGRLGPGFELYTMALDGTDIARLTNNRRPDIWPDWQRLPS